MPVVDDRRTVFARTAHSASLLEPFGRTGLSPLTSLGQILPSSDRRNHKKSDGPTNVREADPATSNRRSALQVIRVSVPRQNGLHFMMLHRLQVHRPFP